tara:strand:- start:36 stop:566 length:531 start_codon:yes stop_codon:yes gene_type:complete
MWVYFRTMPISFIQAKAIVSPFTPVIPGSKEHRDILELMRQSGVIFAEENIAVPHKPLGRVRQLWELAAFRQRKMEEPQTKSVSKMNWLSIDANKKYYEEHIVKHQTVPIGYYEPEPRHHSWAGKTATNWKGQSKRQWIANLKENQTPDYNNNGPREESEVAGKAEGGEGESKSSP